MKPRIIAALAAVLGIGLVVALATSTTPGAGAAVHGGMLDIGVTTYAPWKTPSYNADANGLGGDVIISAFINSDANHTTGWEIDAFGGDVPIEAYRRHCEALGVCVSSTRTSRFKFSSAGPLKFPRAAHQRLQRNRLASPLKHEKKIGGWFARRRRKRIRCRAGFSATSSTSMCRNRCRIMQAPRECGSCRGRS